MEGYSSESENPKARTSDPSLETGVVGDCGVPGGDREVAIVSLSESEDTNCSISSGILNSGRSSC